MSRPVLSKSQWVRDNPEKILERRWPIRKEPSYLMGQRVGGILERVKRLGDKALVQYTRWFDNIELSPSELRVPVEDLSEAYSLVTDEEVDALRLVASRIRYVAEETLRALSFTIDLDGTKITSALRPLASVGCYVPGGEAAYPSSLLMCTIPALVAGVERIVVCTPPKQGGISPLTLVAADICGVTEVYQIGGAQAIAALAFGTESVRPVQKIVGPGNAYVSLAKKMVSQDTLIDMPAGPSELLVIADESASARNIALDMLSQTEHSRDAVAVLVSPSRDLCDTVATEIDTLALKSPRQEVVREAMRKNGGIYCLGSIKDCVEFANTFAAEHVQVMTKEPSEVAGQITKAGLVLLGEYTPVAASDYGLGVNHVLPTEGYAATFSGLTVLDFVRIVRIVESSATALQEIAPAACMLAEAEGLQDHARAIQGRFEK